MPKKSDNPFKFWEELKRRKVIQVVTLYASSSFVIIEVINNLAEPLNLPSNLLTIIVIILAIGFPLAIILSWLFDLTSKGVEKTKPLNEIEDGEKPSFSSAWKTATFVSFAVIAILLFLNLTGNLKNLKAGDFQSLIVLPFDNFTGSDDSEFYVSGIHSSLITDMGRIGALRLPGKTSSNRFKDTDMSVKQIAEEMNVNAAVEGSISCFGEDSVCIQIRLIRAIDEEKLLWVKDYRVAKSQILNFYNDVTKEISREINIALTQEEESLLAEKRTIDPQAYDAYLLGQYYWEKLDPESMQKAEEYFKIAIEKEPEWADPYARLASVYSSFYILPKSVTLPLKYKYLNKALELDPNSAEALYVNALTAVWTELDWAKGEKEFLKSIELNPNNALTRLYYSHLLMILHRSDEAIKQANIGLDLDPIRPLVVGLYGVVMTGEGHYQSAISAFEKARALAPDFGFTYNILPALYRSGDYEGWIKYWEMKVNWDDDAKSSVIQAFHKEGHLAAVEEMFKMHEKYGSGPGNAHLTNSLKAQRSMYLNKPEEAIDYLESLLEFDPNSLNVTYIGTNLYFYDQLKEYPRYIQLLKKLNLPTED